MKSWAVLFLGVASAATIHMGNHETLSFGVAQVRWGSNSSHIEIEMTYPAKGWIAFGSSPDGRVDSGNYLFGYVNDTTGEVVVQDRHIFEDLQADIDYMMLDNHQDWIKVSGMQNNTHTVIRAVRRLQTCEKEDRPFLLDGQHAVFAMSVLDPPSKTDNVTMDTAKTGKMQIDLGLDMSAADIKTANYHC